MFIISFLMAVLCFASFFFVLPGVIVVSLIQTGLWKAALAIIAVGILSWNISSMTGIANPALLESLMRDKK